MKLKSRRERILFGAALLVILGAFAWVGYDKVTNILNRLDEEISDLERSLREKKHTEKSDRAIADRYVRVREELTIPGSESEVKSSIREELTKLLGGERGPAYTTILAKDPQRDREGFLTTYQFSIDNIKAITIGDLARFLDKMERESEVLEIESIQISNPRQSRDASPEAQYEFSVPQIVISRLVYTESDKKKTATASPAKARTVEEDVESLVN